MHTFAKRRINSTVEFSNLKLKMCFKKSWGQDARLDPSVSAKDGLLRTIPILAF